MFSYFSLDWPVDGSSSGGGSSSLGSTPSGTDTAMRPSEMVTGFGRAASGRPTATNGGNSFGNSVGRSPLGAGRRTSLPPSSAVGSFSWSFFGWSSFFGGTGICSASLPPDVAGQLPSMPFKRGSGNGEQ